MEILKTKFRGCEVSVLFTGSQYIFHNQFYGLLAVADRKGYKSGEENYFTIYYGNKQTVGGSLDGECCFLLAKKFIKKHENKYIEHNIFFEESKVDLDAWYIDCKVLRR